MPHAVAVAVPLLAALALAAPASAPAPDARPVLARFEAVEKARLAPLLQEVVRFPTVAGNVEAFRAQSAWLRAQAEALGLAFRDEGEVVEIELPGPPGAPVLGLMVHGDVVPVEEEAWSIPPFSGALEGGFVLGRGAVDDKGPLVQALLAMSALKNAGVPRTHAVKLLVGSDEESGSSDVDAYLAKRPAPDVTLVLDSYFPVVVGEKAWNALALTVDPAPRAPGAALRATSLEAGLSASIVPDRARLVVEGAEAELSALLARLQRKVPAQDTRIVVARRGGALEIVARGRSAHSGVNVEGGRNALVSLARMMDGELPPSGIDDLLAFAREAGADLYGAGLALPGEDPLWGRYFVNVATVKPTDDGRLRLTINVRRPPPFTGPRLKEHLEGVVERFARRTGARFEVGGYWDDEPLVFDREAPIVRRLLDAYARATGERAKPAISGGGSYAKRMPRSIAFGMWFPERPYPGHDVDEKNPIASLERGSRVLIEALVDLACGPPMVEPFGASPPR